MPLMTCPKCERFHYVPDECLAPKLTAARKDVPGKTTVRDALAQIGTIPPVKAVQPPVSQEAAFASTGDSIRRRVPDPNTAAGTQAPPVDTKPQTSRKADRHPPGYQAAKQKLYRERKKAKT